MKIMILKQTHLFLSVCCILFIGCRTVGTADNLLGTELLQEIRDFREEISHDIQDDFVKKCISSIESSSTLVHVHIIDSDTLVEICVFDTSALCNRGRGDFVYSDCLTVGDKGNKIFISDRYWNVFYKRKLSSKWKKTKVEFTDGLFRYYYYRNGNLIQFSLPLPSYEETVVMDEI